MKLCTVVGARPQFIKAAALAKAMKAFSIDHILIHTGQHFDPEMSDIFFKEMGIPTADYNLAIHDGSHGAMTGRMLEKIEEILLKEKPDCLLVYGDTNSTLAGALAAVKLHIPVAHVEAGLRSFNRRMPEEINRIACDSISDILFTPTEIATKQLLKEGVDKTSIYQVGDVMYDIAKNTPDTSDILEKLSLRNYILATIHRAENTDDPARLKAIFQGLVELKIPVVLPLHPRTKAVLDNLDKIRDAITVIDPVGYLDMTALEKGAEVIITDSGGVQKEAFFHQTPCVTVRDETEWTELLDGGYMCLTKPDNIPSTVKQMQEADIDWNHTLYGDGHASEKILETLTKIL